MQRMILGQQPARAAPVADRHDPVVPPVWELTCLAVVVAALAAVEAIAGDDAYPVLNVIAPLVIMAVLGAGASVLAWRRENAIWTPLFWFRAATAVYFGFGTAVPEFVNESSRLYAEQLYRALPNEIHKLNQIVAMSVLLVLLVARTVILKSPPIQLRRPSTDGSTKLIVLGLIFAVIGYAVRFLIIIPGTIGVYQAEFIAGSILGLGILAPVSLYMLTSYGIRFRRSLLPVPIALLIVDILTGLALFNKSHALMSMLMFALGWLSHRVTAVRAALTTVIIIALFQLLPPVTDFGREEIVKRYGPSAVVSLTERLEIIGDYSRLVEYDPFEERVQSSLLRLSYVNAAALAINWHDSGSPGPSLEHFFIVFIPRFLWPEKPEITRIGVEFSIKAMGNPNTSTAPGIFADVYWAMGWTGIALLMPLMGAIFAATSLYALSILDAGKWEFFPVILTAMRMGTRVDGYYVADIIGPLIFLAALHLCGRLAQPVLAALLRHSPMR